MKDDGYRILIAPAGDDPVFAQREEGISHTPYDTERAFYSRIRAGDPEGVRRLLESYLSGGIVVGRMSRNPLTQMKYFAVCCVTLACRYAIAGGLGEQEAFNFSDKCIARIDAMTDGGKIVEFLSREAQRLAAMVGESRSAAAYSPPVRKCMAYIARNLHDKITLADLSGHTGLSPGYLSRLFRADTGESVHGYILGRKLEAAKSLVERGGKMGETAYALGFSSESHFIALFKKRFGVTPAVWARRREVPEGEPEGEI